ncbi:hypothetical protein GCM10009557_15030 [Virgisporangium ochraceum]|uniref:Uncharacterized protein n=1 Tax=Virgisporangium ochraceum TaxID=65505 RepID=A0A8J3ZNQ5_9ACTN|nr:hypothetical protein [Virgisporangium ochraceum]GIJ66277.1 hypothetical protein Voc01_011940 [Virgisporangium ochraceum]
MIVAEPTGGMQPGIPDEAYVYTLGAVFLAVCLAVCAHQAWKAIRATRWYLRRQRPTPGQRVDAAPSRPTGRALGRAAVPSAFDALVAANPDLAAVDIARLADLYLIPASEEQS